MFCSIFAKLLSDIRLFLKQGGSRLFRIILCWIVNTIVVELPIPTDYTKKSYCIGMLIIVVCMSAVMMSEFASIGKQKESNK